MKHKRMVEFYKGLQAVVMVMTVVFAILYVSRIESMDYFDIIQEIPKLATYYGWCFGAMVLLQGLANYHKKLYRRMINSKFAKWFR